jgi:hypothetical protein
MVEVDFDEESTALGGGCGKSCAPVTTGLTQDVGRACFPENWVVLGQKSLEWMGRQR